MPPIARLDDTVAIDSCCDLRPDALSRRGFVSAATWSALSLALAACGGDATGPGTTPVVVPRPNTGATFAGGVLTVPLSGAPDLDATNGFHVFAAAIGGVAPNVIVINLGAGLFRSFTSICTHEQCTVGEFTGSRITCPCHGSQFDTAGRNVVGPAPSPLKEFSTSFDAGTRVVTVVKG